MKRKSRSLHLRKYKKRIMRDVFLFSSKDIDEISMNIPPLIGSDKLFVRSENPNDPRLMPTAIDNELYYEYGYLGTTIFLLNIIEYGKSYIHKDSYIYPALFCFRQYIENMIKVIGHLYQSDIEFGSNHNLVEYWETIQGYIGKSIETDNVLNIIRELQESDTRATAYRYPGALNAAFYKNKTPIYSMLIDVNELKIRVLQVYRFFDGLYEESCKLNAEN